MREFSRRDANCIDVIMTVQTPLVSLDAEAAHIFMGALAHWGLGYAHKMCTLHCLRTLQIFGHYYDSSKPSRNLRVCLTFGLCCFTPDYCDLNFVLKAS